MTTEQLDTTDHWITEIFTVCLDGPAYAELFDDPNEAWHKCKRPDWMIWLLRQLGMTTDDCNGLSRWLSQKARFGTYPWNNPLYTLGSKDAGRADQLRELWPDFPLCPGEDYND